MIKKGKWGKLWDKYRYELKKEYFRRGITHCEVRLGSGCFVSNFLGFAHRYKRTFYHIRGNSELLGSFQHTVLACVHCHAEMETSRALTEKIFEKLRPEKKGEI